MIHYWEIKIVHWLSGTDLVILLTIPLHCCVLIFVSGLAIEIKSKFVFMKIQEPIQTVKFHTP